MSEQNGGWGELLRGENGARSLVVGGGMAMHAINVFIVITILPSVVSEIGGLEYFAWSTTLYVIASVLGGGFTGRLMPRLGARNLYRGALGLFAIGSAACAMAPTMEALLVARFVQGLGAGTLSALSYTMVRALFPERLWPAAISVISASWGVATFGGPAVGGMFAEYGAWRWAFWAVCAVAPCLWLLVERSLPRDLVRPPRPKAAMAYFNLFVLCASVFAVSVGSAAVGTAGKMAGLAIALCGLALFVRLENGGGKRLLPKGACKVGLKLGATYAAIMMAVVGINTEIFVPYFLQTLHGMAPVNAGYLSALMSVGWTAGSMIVAGASTTAVPRWMLAGPLVIAGALAGMFVLMPVDWGGLTQIVLLGMCLLAQGLGIGMCWPHLCARLFVLAPEGEKNLAASSLTIVIMVSNAIGSALAGMVTNLAGLSTEGVAGAAAAAWWLFAVFLLAPLLAVVSIRRILAVRPA